MLKKWTNNILRGVCLTSVAFVFQACYGTGQDIGMDRYIHGQVKSRTTGLPIKGIKVSIDNSMQYTHTDENGNFSMYSEMTDSTTMRFQDIDGTVNKSYIDKDTLLVSKSNEIILEIELEEKK